MNPIQSDLTALEILKMLDYDVSSSLDDKEIAHSTKEATGWGFFTDEISFFLVDFCEQQLNPIQKLIFYSYYVNDMTVKEIADRIYTYEHTNSFEHHEECSEDDKVIKDIDSFHSNTYSILSKINKIEEKLRYSWKYMDRWDDKINTRKLKEKIKIKRED